MSAVIHPATVPGTTRVTASITETRHDPMATAYFVNVTRASAYAQQLLDSGDYPFVQIEDTDGKMWVLAPEQQFGVEETRSGTFAAQDHPVVAEERWVVRVDDDHPEPVRGKVIGWEDEDRCLVLWGDAAYTDDTTQARVEYADELAPIR